MKVGYFTPSAMGTGWTDLFSINNTSVRNCIEFNSNDEGVGFALGIVRGWLSKCASLVWIKCIIDIDIESRHSWHF